MGAEPEIDTSIPVATAAPYVPAAPNAPQVSIPPQKQSTTVSYTIPAASATPVSSSIQKPPAPGVQTTVPAGYMKLGKDPSRCTCPHCNQTMVTRTTHKIDTVTILLVIVMLLVFWPLFFLPLIIPGCKATEHYCTSCQVRSSFSKIPFAPARFRRFFPYTTSHTIKKRMITKTDVCDC